MVPHGTDSGFDKRVHLCHNLGGKVRPAGRGNRAVAISKDIAYVTRASYGTTPALRAIAPTSRRTDAYKPQEDLNASRMER
jgi:hypothetical protein